MTMRLHAKSKFFTFKRRLYTTARRQRHRIPAFVRAMSHQKIAQRSARRFWRRTKLRV